jgi:hypothetical protein
MFEFKFGTVSLVLPLSLFHLKNRVCLSRGVGSRCDMAGSDEDRGRSRRSDAEDQGGSHRSDTQWSDDQKVR